MGGLMGKPHPMELRTRVVAYVDEGHGHREAARHFRVSPKFVNDLVKLRRETGLLTPKRQGNGGGYGKLAGVTDWLKARVTKKGEITLNELVVELDRTHGIAVHRATVWRVLRGLGLTQKKPCRRLNRSARTSPLCAMSGSRDASLSWPTIWSDWRSSMRPGSRRTWPRPPAGRLVGSASSIMRRSDIGEARPSLQLCAMTGWTRLG